LVWKYSIWKSCSGGREKKVGTCLPRCDLPTIKMQIIKPRFSARGTVALIARNWPFKATWEMHSGERDAETGLPDGIHFQTKNPTSGKFWGVLQWKMLVYFMAIWAIFDIFYGHLVYIFCGNLVYFSSFWYVVPREIWQPCA
jgi:hypothetical protein